MAHETEFTKKKECEVKAIPLEEKKRMVKDGQAHWFFPHHVIEQAVQCLIVLMILVTFSTLFPAHLGPKADPFDTPAHIKPEWYFLAAFYSLKFAENFDFLGAWAPKLLGIVMQGVAMNLLVLAPFIDFGDPKVRNPRKRPIAMAIGAAAAIGTVAFSILGWLA